MTDQLLLSSTSPVAWQQLTAHPLAEMFPLMTEAELAELTADIEENDLQEAIDLYEGQILDGRNRHAACLRCGIEPRFVEYKGNDPLGYIISKNLHRRHLSQAAKGEVVTKILMKAPEMSDRAIGRMARVDGKTVAARRAELEASAEIPHFDTRKDSKGHSRPARPSSASGDKLAAEVMEDVAAAIALADAPSDIGEPLRLPLDLTKPLGREASEDAAVIAFLGVLHKSDHLYRCLSTLTGLLFNEERRIAQLPRDQREALARQFLACLHIAADLRPVAGAAAFEGSIH